MQSAPMLFVTLLLAIKPAVAEAVVKVELSAGEYDLQAETPVSAVLPEGVLVDREVCLRCVETGERLPAQVGDERLWWILKSPLSRGHRRRYEVDQQTGRVGRCPRVTVTDDGARLIVQRDDRAVLHYHHAVVPSPLPDKPYYRRSGFVHPVFSPRGRIVTDGMPANHMHQHGIMFAWRNTTYAGREVDFWNSHAEQGRVEHVSIDQLDAGPVWGRFCVTLQHVDLTAPHGPKIVLREKWHVRVFATSNTHVWDLASEQIVMGERPLQVNEFHYGGFMIRGSAAWAEPPGCELRTSRGLDRVTGNHTRPDWVAIHGPVEKEVAGIVAMSHPTNFRSPQPVRLHPSMPYFCFAPMVAGPFTLEPGQPYRSRFRLVVHDEVMDAATAQDHWQAYAAPPQATMSSL